MASTKRTLCIYYRLGRLTNHQHQPCPNHHQTTRLSKQHLLVTTFMLSYLYPPTTPTQYHLFSTASQNHHPNHPANASIYKLFGQNFVLYYTITIDRTISTTFTRMDWTTNITSHCILSIIIIQKKSVSTCLFFSITFLYTSNLDETATASLRTELCELARAINWNQRLFK